MLFLLSPAKTLDFSPAPEALPATGAELSADTSKLAAVTRKLKTANLRQRRLR